MTERTRLLSYSRTTIPKRGVIFLWSALALVINITLSSLRSMRLEVLSARKNGAREEMERLPESAEISSWLRGSRVDKCSRKHEVVCWTRQ